MSTPVPATITAPIQFMINSGHNGEGFWVISGLSQDQHLALLAAGVGQMSTVMNSQCRRCHADLIDCTCDPADDTDDPFDEQDYR